METFSNKDPGQMSLAKMNNFQKQSFRGIV